MSEFKPEDYIKSEFVSSVLFDIILTIITCGIFNLFVQHRQIKAVNYMIKSHKYNFWKWLFFSIITCGIYHVYYEYMMAGDLNSVIEDKSPNFQPMVLILAIFAMPVIADAIMQSKINKHFGFEQV